MLNVIVTVIVILITISTTIAVFNYHHMIFASHDVDDDTDDDDKSILPNYREGYKVGEVQGIKETQVVTNMMMGVLVGTVISCIA